MCGITALCALEGPLDPRLRDALPAMNGRLAHRGPDGDGFHQAPRAALGHRRLAIIDRAGGAQPMSNEDGSCWIVFNGEVYNHRSLRGVLEDRGHVFRTHSDTEAILHAWEEYGTSCPEHLEGMFAFAIWDERRQELFVARDRLGKKPLFYAVFDNVLHVASELGALRASPGWRAEPDLDALEGYLSLGYFRAPGPAWRGVRKLEPAHWLHVSNGRIRTRRYWDVPAFDTHVAPAAATIDAIDETLCSAVQDRLESEVPLGAFLSGGIDSGLIVSYMAEALGDRLVTTTVGFADAAHNELEAAAVTASRFGARHFPHVIEPRLDEVFDALVTGFGEPRADTTAIPTWYVSRSAREHVVVALSGDGGDETFAGYDFRYVPHAYEDRVRRLTAGTPGRRVARWLGHVWPRSRSLPRPLRLGTLFENISRDPASAYYFDLCFLKPWATRALLGQEPLADPAASPVYAAVTEPYRRCPSADALQRAEYADLTVYMPNDPLVKVDRMSMAHGLEVRSPLLDRRVVELAFRIPASMKQRGRTGKVLLRELARRRLPEGLSSRPKRGFTLPIGDWIAGPFAGAYQDEVLSDTARVRGLLDTAHLAMLFREQRAGAGDHSYALWATWVLERWLRTTSRVPSGDLLPA
jgi:asparagine synthase (glutamine-hydrolysing)